ncbi:hypothetical protein POTOM_029731 [Populus tomentosa]|uniref:Uncharacterized protein n=1 Tax=Populus tomentosa TaxID=118781 RepID=A0A8X7ZFW6_POPTO|nr:hypothetical protein POTOM_029731 [Populus tomentosa]
MNLEERASTEVPSSEHLCYVRCNFCNTVLAGVSSNEKFLFKEKQGFCTDIRKGESSSSSTSGEQPVPTAPFVVKPPEKKHRLPSAYNREEIKRIKAADPEMPHREAFSTAAKNWARARNAAIDERKKFEASKRASRESSLFWFSFTSPTFY